ncbi:hypothetical protein KCP69_26330 [Salmonella enterica subsp. enterica]|nr:hypothetical protein KCP69_26330 [Salmonella enterica subsp. enterica]
MAKPVHWRRICWRRRPIWIIGVGTPYRFHHPPQSDLPELDVRYLNINVSRFDVFSLDGVQMQGDARVALTCSF